MAISCGKTLFPLEACPAALTTLREADEERSCADIIDTVGYDPHATSADCDPAMRVLNAAWMIVYYVNFYS
jgi:hypothetical protein